jgi:hypothetical protein
MLEVALKSAGIQGKVLRRVSAGDEHVAKALLSFLSGEAGVDVLGGIYTLEVRGWSVKPIGTTSTLMKYQSWRLCQCARTKGNYSEDVKSHLSDI